MFLLLLATMVVAKSDYCQEDKKQDQLDDTIKKKLDDLLKQLAADDPEVRKKAQEELEKFVDTEAKKKYVEDAMKKGDYDLQTRGLSILGTFSLRKNGPIIFVKTEKRKEKYGERQVNMLYLVNCDGSNPRKVVDEFNSSVSWSPTGEHFAYTINNKIVILDRSGKKINETFKYGVGNVAWSPDGKKLSYIASNHLHISDVNGSNEKKLEEVGHSEIKWSPDSKKIALLARDDCSMHVCTCRIVKILDIKGIDKSITSSVFTSHHESRACIEWSDNGKNIFVSGKFGSCRKLKSLEPKEWEDVSEDKIGESKILAIPGLFALSPDSTKVSYVRDSKLCVMDATGKEKQIVSKQADNYPPSWSSDGKWIAFTTKEQKILLIQVNGGGELLLCDGIRPLWAPK